MDIREEIKSAKTNLTKCDGYIRTCKDSITRLETLIGQYQFELDGIISKSEKKDFQYLKQLISENSDTTTSKQKEKYSSEKMTNF